MIYVFSLVPLIRGVKMLHIAPNTYCIAQNSGREKLANLAKRM